MKVTIDKAVKSMVPDGTTYNKLLEYAINAVNMARMGDDADAADNLFKMRLVQDGIEDISGALLAVAMRHAQMICKV